MTDFFDSDHISPETIFVHKQLIRIEDELRNKDNIPPNYPMMIFWAISFAFGVLIGMNAYAQFLKLITILHESGDSVLLEELKLIIETSEPLAMDQGILQTLMDKIVCNLGGPSRMPTAHDIVIATQNVINNHLINHATNELSEISSQCGWERPPIVSEFSNPISLFAAQAMTSAKNALSGPGAITCITQIASAKISRAIYTISTESSILSATLIGLASAIWYSISAMSFIIPYASHRLIKAYGTSQSDDIALRNYRKDQKTLTKMLI